MNKICFTPTPFPYIHSLHWIIMIFCCTVALPLLAMAFMSIEEVAQEIEDPFGDDLNDLPTETIGPGITKDCGLARVDSQSGAGYRDNQRAVLLTPNGVEVAAPAQVTVDVQHEDHVVSPDSRTVPMGVVVDGVA